MDGAAIGTLDGGSDAPSAPAAPSVALEPTPRIDVLPGAVATVKIRITRGGGANDPVQIVVRGFPATITAQPVVIPAGANEGDLVVTAQASAVQGESPLEIEATEGPLRATGSTSVLVRGLPGSPDLTFGINGRVDAPFGDKTPVATQKVLVQEDGKVIVAARCYEYLCLARLEKNGARDMTFAGGVFDGSPFRIHGAELLPDGSIALASLPPYTGGPVTARAVEMRRLTPNGVLDTSIGVNGVVTLPIQATRVWDLQRGPTGDLYLNHINGAWSVARLAPDFSVRTAFGTNGVFQGVSPHFEIRADNRIYGFSNGAAFYQLTADGATDTTFGTAGWLTVPVSGTAVAYAVTERADGRLAGVYSVGETMGFLAGASADGKSVDATLPSTAGHFVTAAMRARPGGGFVVAGSDGQRQLMFFDASGAPVATPQQRTTQMRAGDVRAYPGARWVFADATPPTVDASHFSEWHAGVTRLWD